MSRDGFGAHHGPALGLAKPLAIVAKALAGLAVVAVAFQQRLQRLDDLAQRYQLLEQEAEPRADEIAAYEDRVLVAAAADHADVALVGADAAIRAAGHADADLLVGQAQPLDLLFQL